MSGVDRTTVNQRLTELLQGFGFEPGEEHDDALNDITHWIADLIDGPKPEPEPDMSKVAKVVSRYGGFTHLATSPPDLPRYEPSGRHFTLCMGTSSWPVDEWAKHNDHPSLSIEEMRALPLCPQCVRMAALMHPVTHV